MVCKCHHIDPFQLSDENKTDTSMSSDEKDKEPEEDASAEEDEEDEGTKAYYEALKKEAEGAGRAWVKVRRLAWSCDPGAYNSCPQPHRKSTETRDIRPFFQLGVRDGKPGAYCKLCL